MAEVTVTFLKLASALVAEKDQVELKKMLKAFSVLNADRCAALRSAMEPDSGCREAIVDAMLSDVLPALGLMITQKNALPDSSHMSVLDFKRHMDYGRVINQLKDLKNSLLSIRKRTFDADSGLSD